MTQFDGLDKAGGPLQLPSLCHYGLYATICVTVGSWDQNNSLLFYVKMGEK
jgi:hypothetical protein